MMTIQSRKNNLLLLLLYCLIFVILSGNIGHHCQLLSTTSSSSWISFPGSEDEVTSLPGLNYKPNFRHYSGYLESVNNTYLHYWFFESQNNTNNDPVVLWLNGGPGCSSVLGALTEQGPIHINSDRSLIENKYSWNQRTNIIFLESPAGVGFSYREDKNYKTGDNQTAFLNYEALKSFFVKFPHLKRNDFYIAGESYGGIYVPTLSMLVLQNKFPQKFRGFAIGNGYLDRTMNGNSLIHFAYYHGLFDSTLWDELVNRCCDAKVTNIKKCDFVNNSALRCKLSLLKMNDQLTKSPLNMYNIYTNCNSTSTNSEYLVNKLSREHIEKRFVRKYLLNLDIFNSDYNAKMEPPCMNYDYVEEWINQKSVRNALNIRKESNSWSPCSTYVSLHYVHEYSSMTKTIQYLLHNGLKALIYNGDVDAMCNFIGDQW